MSITSSLMKIAGVATISGGIILGSLVIFNGEQTIETAKDTITSFAEKLNLYESNETALILKITELKDERDSLKDQLIQLEGKQLADAEEIIASLEAQITELESQAVAAESNGEVLAERITQLESEVKLANEKTSELQVVLDETSAESQPLTEEELADVTGELVEPQYFESVIDLSNPPGSLTLEYEDENFKIEYAPVNAGVLKVTNKGSYPTMMVETSGSGSTGSQSKTVNGGASVSIIGVEKDTWFKVTTSDGNVYQFNITR